MQELLPEHLGNRQTIRDNTQRGEEIVKIPLSKIIIREGFNVRVDYGDLEGLATSILENGQMLPGRVDVLADGMFVLTDGHRRFKAMQLLEAQGNEPMFKAIVNTAKTTEEQRILQMFTTQDNKQLTPHECAELIKRLVNLGYAQSEVAKKIGKTPGYVSQMLEYANESPEIKKHVQKGNLSVSTALKIKKAVPSTTERVKAVNKAVEAKGEAKTVTAEAVTNEKATKAEKIADEIMAYLGWDSRDDTAHILSIIKKYWQ